MIVSLAQYAHDVVLKSVRRRFDVMDVVWTSKRRRVLTGQSLYRLCQLPTVLPSI